MYAIKTATNKVIYFSQQNGRIAGWYKHDVQCCIYIYIYSVSGLVNDFLYHRESTFLSMRTHTVIIERLKYKKINNSAECWFTFSAVDLKCCKRTRDFDCQIR